MERPAFLEHLSRSLSELDAWETSWGEIEVDESLWPTSERVDEVLHDLNQRLHDNFPYGHPRYAGQMLKPPHPVAVLAYATAMQINPNNHALDGGAATSFMEREVVAKLAAMLGYGEQHLGHLTGGGTIANLEALWIARSLHPGKAIAASEQAHYTHARACEILGLSLRVIPSDHRGRMDLDALETTLRTGEVSTVVATAGTTGLGSVDPVHEILPLARAHGARVHVDAAYGGFFTLLAQPDSAHSLIEPFPFLAIGESDSVVVDPHKHGLQPYGCGSVMFRDPTVGRFYVHDSPYTYFTSSDLHLGEISLECSRAGATAAALWATLECLPLAADHGLGPILAKCRRAALEWAQLIEASDRFRLVTQPDLDIIAFYAVPDNAGRPKASAISALTDHLFQATMDDTEDPVFLAKLIVKRNMLEQRDDTIVWDQPTVTVLRSVLMKPEHLAWVPRLHAAVTRHAGAMD